MSDILRDIFLYDTTAPLLFTRFYFWAFFAVVYALFALIIDRREQNRGRMHMRNVYLMAVSWFFYYKTSGIFLLILAFVTLSDWLIAQQIDRTRESKAKSRAWLVLSVVIDLGLLAYFKYAYFFTNMLNDMFGLSLEVFDLF